MCATVLATVIGHQHEKGWIITDAGWMALSRDRGTARQKVDQGYGVVCDLSGKPYPDLIVADANQEHGIVTLRRGSQGTLPDLPDGARLRTCPTTPAPRARSTTATASLTPKAASARSGLASTAGEFYRRV